MRRMAATAVLLFAAAVTICPAAGAQPGPDDVYWKYLSEYGVSYHDVFSEQEMITQGQAVCLNINQSPTAQTYQMQIDRLVAPNFPRDDATGMVDAAIYAYCTQHSSLIYG